MVPDMQAPTVNPSTVAAVPKTAEELVQELHALREHLQHRTEEVMQLRAKHDQQHQYYQQVLLTIVENLKIMMRTIAILAGKAE